MGSIQHIFVAPRRGEQLQEMQAVEALENRGLHGDRYTLPAHYKPPGNHVTLIEAEKIQAFTQATGLPLAPHEPRRNLVTTGVNLNELCGMRFLVGEVELEGWQLCEPCTTFSGRTYPEVLNFFVHKGGLRARIIRGGIIRVGDCVSGALPT